MQLRMMHQENEDLFLTGIDIYTEAHKTVIEKEILSTIDFDNVEDILDFSVQPASKPTCIKHPSQPQKLIAEDPVKLLELQPIICKFVTDEEQDSELDGNTKGKGKRRFRCIFCGNKFIRSSHLNRHLRIHTGDKPYFCPVCRKRFSRIDYMKAHLNSHDTEMVHYCCVCRMAYHDMERFTEHCLSHDDSEYISAAMNNAATDIKYSSKALMAEEYIPAEMYAEQSELNSCVMIEKVDNSFKEEYIEYVENPMNLLHYKAIFTDSEAVTSLNGACSSAMYVA